MTIPTVPATMPAMPGAPPAGAQGQQVHLHRSLRDRAAPEHRASRAHANVENNWLYVAATSSTRRRGSSSSSTCRWRCTRGVEDGESWSEGDNEQKEYISALPGGRYTMRLEAQWENWKTPTAAAVHGARRAGRDAGPELLPRCCSRSRSSPSSSPIRHLSFERRRWADSAFNPYDSGGSDDDE